MHLKQILERWHNESFIQSAAAQNSAPTEQSRHVWVEIKQRWSDVWWTLQSSKPQIKSIFTEIDVRRLLHVRAVAYHGQEEVVHVNAWTTHTLHQCAHKQ